MTTEAIALSLTYWINIVLWFGLFVIFARKYCKARIADPILAAATLALTIACLSRWFADLYYGILVSSQYGMLPKVFYAVMSQPQFWLVPKIVTVLGGLVLLLVVLKLSRIKVLHK